MKTPLQIFGDNLKLWFEADRDVYSNTGGTTPITEGGGVLFWKNLVPGGPPLGASSSGNLWSRNSFNGLPGITFRSSGFNALINDSDLLNVSGTEMSAYVVASYLGDDQDGTLINVAPETEGHDQPTSFTFGHNYFYPKFGVSQNNDGVFDAPFQSGVPTIFGCEIKTNRRECFYNGVSAGTPNTASNTPAFEDGSNFRIGRALNGGAGANCIFASVILIDIVPTTHQRQQLHSYLKRKWRIKTDLRCLLDDFGSLLRVVLSFRQLVNGGAYRPCIRIRRSSDDGTGLFYLVNGVVDLKGIAAFVGGGIAYVQELFDQNGQADFQQLVYASQPVFIVDGLANKPCIRFSGTQFLSSQNTTMNFGSITGATEATVMGVLKQDGAKSSNTLFTYGDDSPQHMLCHPTFSDSIYWDACSSGSTRVSAAQPSGWDNTNHVLELYRKSGDAHGIVVDGASLVATTRTETMAITGQTFYLGGAGDSSTFNGDLSELVFMHYDIGASKRAKLRRDGSRFGLSMADYYRITVA